MRSGARHPSIVGILLFHPGSLCNFLGFLWLSLYWFRLSRVRIVGLIAPPLAYAVFYFYFPCVAVSVLSCAVRFSFIYFTRSHSGPFRPSLCIRYIMACRHALSYAFVTSRNTMYTVFLFAYFFGGFFKYHQVVGCCLTLLSVPCIPNGHHTTVAMHHIHDVTVALWCSLGDFSNEDLAIIENNQFTNPCRNMQYRIQKNTDESHMANGGCHNHPNNNLLMWGVDHQQRRDKKTTKYFQRSTKHHPLPTPRDPTTILLNRTGNIPIEYIIENKQILQAKRIEKWRKNPW